MVQVIINYIAIRSDYMNILAICGAADTTMFDSDMIKKRHIEQFPKDCEAAFSMGKRLAESVSN